MSVAAWVDDQPISTAEIDERLESMRSRDRAGSLPVADSREGRQLRRWMTQVAVVERLCAGELVRRSVSDPPTDGSPPSESSTGIPSRADAVALGSIVAAAWAHPAVPTAAEAVSRDVVLAPQVLSRAADLGRTREGTVWSEADLVASARLEEFSRWLARASHERVRLTQGYEHPGDSTQPDNLHRH